MSQIWPICNVFLHREAQWTIIWNSWLNYKSDPNRCWNNLLSACIFLPRTRTRLNSARELQQKLVLWNIYRPNVLQWGRLNASGTAVHPCKERRHLTSFMRLPDARLPNFYAIARRVIAQLQDFTIRQEHKFTHYKDWGLWIQSVLHNMEPINFTKMVPYGDSVWSREVNWRQAQIN